MKRKIIKIEEEKCDGCGVCVPECHEGALQVIDGKVRLISDLFCDGLGACLGHCPQGALTIEEREAEPYDEYKVMEYIVRGGRNVIKAHLEHLRDHNEMEYFNQAVKYLDDNGIELPVLKTKESSHTACGCPGSQELSFTAAAVEEEQGKENRTLRSGLSRCILFHRQPLISAIRICFLPPTAALFHTAISTKIL